MSAETDRPSIRFTSLGLGQDFRVGVCGVWLCVLSMEGACGAAEEAGPATAAARLGWTQLRQQLWELGAVFRKRKHVPLVSEPCVGLSPFKTWVEQADFHQGPSFGLLASWVPWPFASGGSEPAWPWKARYTGVTFAERLAAHRPEHAVGWDAKEPAEVQGHGIPV